jgi:hypothetical protein
LSYQDTKGWQVLAFFVPGWNLDFRRGVGGNFSVSIISHNPVSNAQAISKGPFSESFLEK